MGKRKSGTGCNCESGRENDRQENSKRRRQGNGGGEDWEREHVTVGDDTH